MLCSPLMGVMAATAVTPPWYEPIVGMGREPTKTSAEARSACIVKGVDLQKAIRGATLRRKGAGVTLPDFSEHFATNGTWLLTGPRAPGDGVYTIKSDQFCVQAMQRPIVCRRLLLSRNGNYFTQAPHTTAYAEPVVLSVDK